MAHQFYVAIEGKKQGKFKGKTTAEDDWSTPNV
jgi:hypothetical protein